MATATRNWGDPAGTINTVGGTTNTQNSGGTTTTNTTTGSQGSTSGVTSNVSSSTNMDPTSLAALQLLIKQLSSGGTTEQKTETAKRQQITALTEAMLQMISPDQAFSDAKGLMALNLQQSMEKNMPAIQKAIEGAGTSASSMQGLLSQNMARDSALAASALGGEQAKAYAQQRTGIASVLEALTRPTASTTTALLNALQTAKGAVTSSKSSGSNTSSSSNTGYSNSVQTVGPTSSNVTLTPNTTDTGTSAITKKYIDLGGTPDYTADFGNTYTPGRNQDIGQFLEGMY